MQIELTTDDEATATDIEFQLEPGFIFTRLSETVRNHYRRYLEKQLLENVRNWSEKSADASKSPSLQDNIPLCAKKLEERAIRACMMAQIYQRTMVKIIANVNDYTKACRLESHLLKFYSKDSCVDLTPRPKLSDKSSQTQTTTQVVESIINNKATQTDTSDLREHPTAQSLPLPPVKPHRTRPPPVSHENDFTSLTLQQKIKQFQAHLNKEKAAEVAAFRKHAAPLHNFELRRAVRHKRKRSTMEVPSASSAASSHSPRMPPPAPPPVQPPPPPPPPPPPIELTRTQHPTATFNKTSFPLLPDQEEDLIAQELEQIFSEESSELDQLFGIDSSVPDDPQICSILREIENAKMPHERLKLTTPLSSPPAWAPPTSSSPVAFQNRINAIMTPSGSTLPMSPILANVEENQVSTLANAADDADARAELLRSLWPCELFMQRRRLSAALSRLIEEDFRWHEVIKWKFDTLFGEDSDDEFAACSPSIELDEVLISSCIRRISPWMVKHLMRPMRDGLIANRFLFKKLAKRLGCSIIMENQYPDERMIKHAVEKYFCLHQAVMSADDLADISSISFKDED